MKRSVPGAEARLLDGDGHLTLAEQRVSEVHAWLSQRLWNRPARATSTGRERRTP
jgi:hypothetical protein